MLKMRFKKIGRKKQPIYRIVIMENLTRRESRSIDEIGYYDPLIKKLILNKPQALKWLKLGVKPTRTVLSLLAKK